MPKNKKFLDFKMYLPSLHLARHSKLRFWHMLTAPDKFSPVALKDVPYLKQPVVFRSSREDWNLTRCWSRWAVLLHPE